MKVTGRGRLALESSREEEVQNHYEADKVSYSNQGRREDYAPSVTPIAKVTALAPSPLLSELSLPVLLKLLAPKYRLPIILGFSVLSLSDSSLAPTALAPPRVRSLHWATSSAKSCRPSRVRLSSDERRRGRRQSIEVVVLVGGGERSESREEERSTAGSWRMMTFGGVERTVSSSEGSNGRAEMTRKDVACSATNGEGGQHRSIAPRDSSSPCEGRKQRKAASHVILVASLFPSTPCTKAILISCMSRITIPDLTLPVASAFLLRGGGQRISTLSISH